MLLSKALKAKCSPIPSGVASLLMPSLDQLSGKDRYHHAFVQPPAVATASALRARWRPSRCICMCVVRRELRVLSLSLSRWRKVGLPLVLWQEFGPNF